MRNSVRGKVLIVDDVPTNTELLGVVLGQEFDVVQATSGQKRSISPREAISISCCSILLCLEWTATMSAVL